MERLVNTLHSLSFFALSLAPAMFSLVARAENGSAPSVVSVALPSVANQILSSSTGATPVLVAPGVVNTPRRFSSSVSFGASSNLAAPSSIDHSSSIDLGLDPSYLLSDRLTLSGSFSVSKDLDHEQTLSLLNDALVSLSDKGWALGRDAKVSVAAISTLPLSKDSRKRDGLITNITLRPTISTTLAAIGLERVKVGYGIGFTRHVHEFTTSTTGKSNAEWALGNRVTLAWAITDKLGLSILAQHNNAWTYEKNLMQNFRMIEEVTADITPLISFAVGHRNQGSVLKADGVTSNIALFNAESSVVYSSLSYAF